MEQTVLKDFQWETPMKILRYERVEIRKKLNWWIWLLFYGALPENDVRLKTIKEWEKYRVGGK